MASNGQIAAIPGWFTRADVQAFRSLLEATGERWERGDLAELGVYLGKSAALIGAYQRPGEQFTVIDLFEQPANDAANADENADQYPDLTRDAFEANYLGVHDALPNVVTGYSQTITDHAPKGTHRFVHIDASHLYEHVVGDLAATRELLLDDGVVVMDDFRSEHTPGVAAAAWQCEGLRPFLVTSAKMYATWGDPEPWRAALMPWLANTSADHYEVQRIGDDDVLRVWANAPKFKRYVPPAALPALTRLRARVGR